MGGFYSVISFLLIAERQGLAVKMDDSFLHLSWVFMSVRKSRFWRLHRNLFLLFQERVLRDFSYATLPWEVHLLSLLLTGVLWKRNRPSVSPLPACGQREIIIHAHTNLCLRTVEQAVMQKPSGMGVNGFCCACLSHLVIQSFHSACFTARGLWKGKNCQQACCFYIGKMIFRLFLTSLFSL